MNPAEPQEVNPAQAHIFERASTSSQRRLYIVVAILACIVLAGFFTLGLSMKGNIDLVNSLHRDMDILSRQLQEKKDRGPDVQRVKATADVSLGAVTNSVHNMSFEQAGNFTEAEYYALSNVSDIHDERLTGKASEVTSKLQSRASNNFSTNQV